MSYNNYIIDESSAYTDRDEGIIIDFDNQTLGMIDIDSLIVINIDFKHSVISSALDREIKTNYKVLLFQSNKILSHLYETMHFPEMRASW